MLLPLIGDGDAEALVQEGQLPEPGGEDVKIIVDFVKDLIIGQKGRPGAMLLGGAGDFKRLFLEYRG